MKTAADRTYKIYTCRCGENFVLTGGMMLWRYKTVSGSNAVEYYCSYTCHNKYGRSKVRKRLPASAFI